MSRHRMHTWESAMEWPGESFSEGQAENPIDSVGDDPLFTCWAVGVKDGGSVAHGTSVDSEKDIGGSGILCLNIAQSVSVGSYPNSTLPPPVNLLLLLSPWEMVELKVWAANLWKKGLKEGQMKTQKVRVSAYVGKKKSDSVSELRRVEMSAVVDIKKDLDQPLMPEYFWDCGQPFQWKLFAGPFIRSGLYNKMRATRPYSKRGLVETGDKIPPNLDYACKRLCSQKNRLRPSRGHLCKTAKLSRDRSVSM